MMTGIITNEKVSGFNVPGAIIGFFTKAYCVLVLALFTTNIFSQALPDATRRKIDSLRNELQTAKQDTNQIKILLNISTTYYWTYLFRDSAFKYANLVITHTDKIKCNPFWKASALSVLGLYYNFDPVESLRYHLAALKIRQQIHDRKGESASLHNIANIYSLRMGYHTESLKYNLASLKIREELNDKYLIRASYANIAQNYIFERKYDEALRFYHLMGNLEVKGLSRSEVTGRLKNMGVCYCNLGNYDEGLKHLFEGLEIENKTQNKLGINEFNVAIGSCYAKLASSLRQDSAQVKYMLALEYINNGLSGNSTPYIALRRDAYSGLVQVYDGLGDFKNSLFYTTMQQKLMDSLSNSEMRYRIEQLRIQYENELITLREAANHKKIVLEEKALREKLLDEQQAKEEIKILEERNIRELALRDERFLKEKSLSEEKSRFEKSIALEKADHERKQLAKRQVNILLTMGLLFVVIISLLTFYFFRQKNIRNRAIERAESFRKMAELELHSLRAQLNPHFMFNSLNAIQELILKEDNDNSHLYLSRFSDLLRMLLDNANQPFVSLKKEISLLEIYLSLEKLRIPDLQYSIEIDKRIDANQISIPNMIFQPYIENAIWHGLSHKKGDRKLGIKIKQNGDSIICNVEDNGVGRKVSSELKSLYRKEHRSRGMELLSKRFTLLSKEYGSEIQTSIEDLDDNGTATGTKVSIILPHSLTQQTQAVYS